MTGSRRAALASSRYRATIDDLTRLLLAAQDGDQHALRDAVRLGQGEVWRLAAALVDAGAADDVTQDTFVRMWRALPAFRAESSGRTWLLAIARRACADAIRARTRQRRLAGRAAADPKWVGTPIADCTGEHELADLLGELDPDRREALVLTQVVGCTYAEAAQICRVPVGTIRSRVARAREDLAELVRAAEAG
jgi:RNA polymerase sigma-70 factor (ECF subfamily)